ncbi:MAG TPA: S9 family peptidase [Rhizomicrobium sp.]|jgi:dipeptidyl aminopeptidase/acylaminoacyl peptidase
MRRILLAAACLLAATGAQAARPIVPDDIFNVREVSDPAISPDGNWVAYTVGAFDRKTDRKETHIWMTRFDGARTVQLTNRPKESEETPRFSPDGRWIAFVSARGDDKETDALWLMDRSGGEAQKLTSLKGDVRDFAWSPDSKRIVLVVADPDPDADDPDAKLPKPIVIDRYRFLEDFTGYLRKQHDHLYLLDVAGRKTDSLTSGDFSDGLPSWSPDGKEIAFVAKRHKNGDRDNNYGLFVIAAQKGAQPKQIADRYAADTDAERPGGESKPAWSPDGKTIAYPHLGDPKLIEYARDYIATVPSSGGAQRSLTPNLDRNVGLQKFSSDGKWVIFQVEDDRTQYLARVPSGGGAIDRVLGGRNVINKYDSAANGRMAIQLATAMAPDEIYVWDGKSPMRQLSYANADWLKQVHIAPVQEIGFKSKDGTQVNGFMVKPGDGGHFPTILRIHGGPQSQYDNEFEIDWQIFAAHGYAVLAVNPRGSTGRGQAYCAAIFANWGSVDVQDQLAAVDFAVKSGVSDPNRLGVGGWSYGGMLTNYVIASDTRFKAATSGASIADILAGFGTDQYAYDYEMELGQPWKNTATWMKVSYPYLHADRIKTPTLFLGGDLDLNVPLRNGMQMYEALKSQDIDTQLIVYPGQYHGLTRASFLKDRLVRYLAWYDKYVKGHG